jgi:glycosyltransferase involved in cell wall biosynthesis
MKVAFDYQAFTNQSYGGVSRYFVRLAQEFLRYEQDIQIFSPLHRNRYLKELPAEIVHGKELNSFPPKSKPLFLAWNQIKSNSAICNWHPDVIHETYYAAKPVGNTDALRVVTVYDMIHELFPNNFSWLDRTTQQKKISLTRADKIICISHNTKRDLIDIFNLPEEKIFVVHLGFEKFSPNETTVKIQLDKPYLLYVGSRAGYKNFRGLLDAFASSHKLNNDFRLIAFGGGAFNREEINLFQKLGISLNNVQQISGNDEVLGRLYQHARAFIYPSLYEGFGLPPLEAMAHDCPVISSNTSSMPEVIGDAGVYFSPKNIDSIRDAIERTVYSDNAIHLLTQKGVKQLKNFSWQKCAEETLKIYTSTRGR